MNMSAPTTEEQWRTVEPPTIWWQSVTRTAMAPHYFLQANFQMDIEGVTVQYHSANEPYPARMQDGLAHGSLGEAIREASIRVVMLQAAWFHIAEGTGRRSHSLGGPLPLLPSRRECTRPMDAALGGHDLMKKSTKDVGKTRPPPATTTDPVARSQGDGPPLGTTRFTCYGRRRAGPSANVGISSNMKAKTSLTCRGNARDTGMSMLERPVAPPSPGARPRCNGMPPPTI